jgi:hypothetical protein
MGVLVAAVLFGMNLGRFGHETVGVGRMRFGKKGVVGGLGVIAEIVPLGGELVIICRQPMVFGGLQMGLACGMSCYRILLALHVGREP